jgi:hypothetical protein
MGLTLTPSAGIYAKQQRLLCVLDGPHAAVYRPQAGGDGRVGISRLSPAKEKGWGFSDGPFWRLD